MPVILPLLPLLGTLAGVAGTGLSIYESIAQGNAQADAKKAEQQQLQQQQQLAQENARKAVLAARPDAQSQTGGSLLDTGQLGLTPFNALAGSIAGQPGAGYGIEGILAGLNASGLPNQPSGATPGVSGGALGQLLGQQPQGEPNMMGGVFGISGSQG